MPSLGTQMLGSVLALVGWVGVIITCGLPMWRVTAFIGVNIVTAQTIWEGIWMNCVLLSTGHMQCKVYDSMLALSTDLQASRAFIVISALVGFVGLIMVFITGKCTNFKMGEIRKKQVTFASGLIIVLAGLLCLIPVTWTASNIVKEFYNPSTTDAKRREVGASLYIGWGASLMMLLGGALISSSCPPKGGGSTSVKYLVVSSSGAPSRIVSVPSRGASRRPTSTKLHSTRSSPVKSDSAQSSIVKPDSLRALSVKSASTRPPSALSASARPVSAQGDMPQPPFSEPSNPNKTYI